MQTFALIQLFAAGEVSESPPNFFSSFNATNLLFPLFTQFRNKKIPTVVSLNERIAGGDFVVLRFYKKNTPETYFFIVQGKLFFIFLYLFEVCQTFNKKTRPC